MLIELRNIMTDAKKKISYQASYMRRQRADPNYTRNDPLKLCTACNIHIKSSIYKRHERTKKHQEAVKDTDSVSQAEVESVMSGLHTPRNKDDDDDDGWITDEDTQEERRRIKNKDVQIKRHKIEYKKNPYKRNMDTKDDEVDNIQPQTTEQIKYKRGTGMFKMERERE